MSMNSAIAAKDENCVEALALGGQSNFPFDLRVLLKGLQVARRGSQPEDGRSPHFRGKSLTQKSG